VDEEREGLEVLAQGLVAGVVDDLKWGEGGHLTGSYVLGNRM
jgi:hypothetical protein